METDLVKMGQDWQGRISLEAITALKTQGWNLFDLLYDGYTIARVITDIGTGIGDKEELTRLRNEAGNAAIEELRQGSAADYEIFVGAITLKDRNMRESPHITWGDMVFEPQHAITVLRKPVLDK